MIQQKSVKKILSRRHGVKSFSLVFQKELNVKSGIGVEMVGFISKQRQNFLLYVPAEFAIFHINENGVYEIGQNGKKAIFQLCPFLKAKSFDFYAKISYKMFKKS